MADTATRKWQTADDVVNGLMADMIDENSDEIDRRICELMLGVLFQGVQLKDIAGLDDRGMEALYAQAYMALEEERFDAAELMFERVLRLDNLNGRAWMGLGRARQELGKHEMACVAFSAGAAFDPENPHFAAHSAESLIALGHLDDAIEALETAIHWAAQDPKYERLRLRALVLAEGIERIKASQNGAEQ